MATKKCQKHSKEFVELCLAEDCKADLFLCPDCKDVSQHKHSKTDIVSIEDIKSKLKHAW